ncbi:hypothetical protein J8M21_23155 [Pseudoalteromonas luteoviolacea]|nr:hypothetical protein [Pseudoalteromonas luteoviolacea]MBQ4909131.1 hypothetical protein [Pseudoalteromonas luteoviolacea]
MKIVQKRSAVQHTYTFYDGYFNYAYEDGSGSADMDLNYADFPQKSAVQIEQNNGVKHVGYLWCVVGVFQFGYAALTDNSFLDAVFWLVIGTCCVIWALYFKFQYSVFRGQDFNIHIIQDNKHDEIITELNTRRHKQLFAWYGSVNPANEVAVEKEKFIWLFEQGVISKEESERKIAEAEFLSKDTLQVPNGKLN